MRKNSITKQAFQLYSANNPKFFPCMFFNNLFENLSPFFNLWMSAEIVTSMQEKRTAKELYVLVAVTLVGNFLIHAMRAVFRRTLDIQREILQNNESAAFNHKTMSLDYDKMEDPQIRTHRRRIIENSYINSYGAEHMVQIIEVVMSVMIDLALSLILFLEMLVRIISAPFQPAMLLLFAGLIVSLALSMRSVFHGTKKSAEAWKKVGDMMLEENRLGGGYRVDGMDSRIYCQRAKISEIEKSSNEKHRKLWSDVRNVHFLVGIPNGITRAGIAVFSHLIVCLYCVLGVFPVGALIKYVGYLTRLTGNVSDLFFRIQDSKTNEPYLKDYVDYFAIKNEMYQGSLAVEKRSDKKFEIEFKDVSFRYAGQEKNALDHISIKLNVGERLAVVGRNGSGKTTFIKLLCRLYDPAEGEIIMNDFNIRKYDYKEYLELFSIVFQDYHLLSLPLGNNVASAAKWDTEKAERLIEEVGFGERYAQMPKKLETPIYKDFDEDGVNLSGGEAQKLALARALYKDAPFIILDEPTAALDPIAEAEIYSKFDEIVEDKTAIYISHRLSSCRFCDKIAVFDEGRIVQVGTHEELLSDTGGKYYELWNAQAQYYTKAEQTA